MVDLNIAVETEKSLGIEFVSEIRDLQAKLLERGIDAHNVNIDHSKFPHLYDVLEARQKYEKRQADEARALEGKHEAADQSEDDTAYDMRSIITNRPRILDIKIVSPAKTRVSDVGCEAHSDDLYVDGPEGSDQSAVTSLKEMLQSKKKKVIDPF